MSPELIDLILRGERARVEADRVCDETAVTVSLSRDCRAGSAGALARLDARVRLARGGGEAPGGVPAPGAIGSRLRI
jgi:hypothetical protein